MGTSAAPAPATPDTGNTSKQDPPSPTATRREASSEYVERAIRKYGSLERALDAVAGELYDARDGERTLAARVKTLEASQIPAGALVLTGDDKAEFETFRGLATKAADVKKGLDELSTLRKDKADRDAKAAIDEVAEVAGANATVLADMLAKSGATAEVREVTVETAGGKVKEKEAVIRPKGADGKPGDPVPLADHAESDPAWKPYAAALFAAEGGAAPASRSPASPPPPRRPFVGQTRRATIPDSTRTDDELRDEMSRSGVVSF